MLRISFINIAKATERIVPTIKNATLYRSVFRVIVHASLVAKRNLKLSKPFQSLPIIPFEKFNFLKAIMTPNIGI
ncbi:hypothetical protein D3C76_1629330 [compost metagenome]